jgi:hypothetical protein
VKKHRRKKSLLEMQNCPTLCKSIEKVLEMQNCPDADSLLGLTWHIAALAATLQQNSTLTTFNPSSLKPNKE